MSSRVLEGSAGKAEVWPKSPCQGMEEVDFHMLFICWEEEDGGEAPGDGQSAKETLASREKVCGWDLQGDSSFGKLLGRAMGASRLRNRAAGRVKESADRAKTQAGGDGRSMEQCWGGKRAGFGHSPAGKGCTHEAEQRQEQRCPGHGPFGAPAEGRETQSFSAWIDKSLFERLKKKKKKAWKNWLCHFWRTFNIFWSERKKWYQSWKAAPSRNVVSGSALPGWCEGPEIIPVRNRRLFFGFIPAGEPGEGSCSVADFTSSMYRNSDLRWRSVSLGWFGFCFVFFKRCSQKQMWC